MIYAENLTKRYGPLTAIEDVSFRVEKGEILAFLGPNGAGKTTTLRILTCFMPATSGQASIAGINIFDHPEEVKKHIGYLPESPPLYPEMTVSEFLNFVSQLKGIPKKLRAEALSRALESCSLTEVRRRLIGNLSRGFRQRVGLAQALIHRPEVLILDEPTVGLDPKQIIEMRRVIQDLAGEHTVLLSTHILSEATAICQRVIIINKGRILAVDTPESLSSQFRKSEKIRMVLDHPQSDTTERLKAIPGVISVFNEPSADPKGLIVECALGRDIRTDLATEAVNRGWGLLEIKAVTLSLEDVFLKLTEEESMEKTGAEIK